MVIIGTNIILYLELIASAAFVVYMNNNPRKPGYSIDGFVPSARNRHIDIASGGAQNGRMQGVRQRRPGFHTQASPATTQLPRQNSVRLPSPRPINAPTQGIQTAVPTQSIGRRRRDGRTAAPQTQKHGHPRLRKVLKSTAIILIAIIVATSGWLGWKVFRASSKVFGSGSNLLGFLSASPLNCESTGRCTILLAGNSADDPGHDGANLTDSIMLVSVDLQNHTAFMLSVPRDLYVNIPGNGYAKINEAYPDGESEHFSEAGYAKGGMGLLEKTVSQDFGTPVNYYALIDYSAIKDAVDAVGGITINVQSSDPRGLYDPSIDWTTHGPLVKLSNGTHTINGEQALDLARARGDTYGSYGFANSDFERTQNQRLMMLALKDKVSSSSVLANPIKLGQLFDAFGNNVHTDLSTGNIRRIYDITKQISSSNIKSYGLNDATLSGQPHVDLLRSYTTTTGEDALIPQAGLGDFSQIQLYVKQLTSNNPIVREAANVVVLNGGSTSGLAAAEAKVLTNKGIAVSGDADAPTPQANNSIIDNSKGKDPATLKELEALFGNTTATNASLTSTYPNADFIVILGQSQQMPNTPSNQ